MQAKELFEENSNLSQAWIRLDVLLKQITARHTQVRLWNGGWRSESVFWSVKSAIHILAAEVWGEVAQDAKTKVQTIGIWLHHTWLIKGWRGAICHIRLTIIKCDIDWKPVRLRALVFFVLLFLVFLFLVYIGGLFSLRWLGFLFFLFSLFSILSIFFILFLLQLLLFLLFNQFSYLSEVYLGLDDWNRGCFDQFKFLNEVPSL